MAGSLRIGESEWYVMKALWENSPLSGSDIVKAVSAQTDWSQSTILTMVRRLVNKKAVGVLQENVMMYYPLIEESGVRRQETDMFLKRVYEGSVNMLVKGFIESGELSGEELEELKRMLDNTK
jgi:BlaI family penicillinase repressor